MMMVIKKKQLMIAALALAVGTAGYINFSHSDGKTKETASYLGEAQLVDSNNTIDNEDFFAQARIDREAGRSRSIETFNSIISNSNSDEAAKASAEQGVMELARHTQQETAIENLLRAKGFSDAVCYINGDSANVVVKSEALDPTSAALISEIVTEQSGIAQDKIKIMEMN